MKAGKGILVHSKRRSRSLSRSFEQAGYGVTWTGSAASCRDAIAARAVDLVLHDIDSSPSRELMASTNDARLPYLALTNRTEAVLELCRSPHIPNLVVAGPKVAVDAAQPHRPRSLGMTALDLIATADKLSRRQLFGLASHLSSKTPGAGPTSSRSRGANVFSMRARGYRLSGDPARMLRDPLCSRGVSLERAATTVSSAQQLLEAVRRGVDSGVIEDNGSGALELQTGVDLGTLAFGLRFGGLAPARIRALVRILLGQSVWPDVCGSDELHALQAPLQSCRAVVLNIVPERSTEIIGLIARRSPDLSRGTPGRPPPALCARSLQLFTAHDVAQPSCVPDETVAISDSMRAQLRLSAGAVMRPLHGTKTQRLVLPARTKRATPP